MKTPLLFSTVAAAALTALALIAAPAPNAAAQTALARAQVAAPAAPVALSSAARTEALTRASAALNRVANVQGRFAQIAPNGARSTGAVYLSRGQANRVGRLRFEYDAPAQFLVIADGVNVATIDRALKSTTRVGIGETPLYFLLKPNIDLDRDTRIVQVARSTSDLLISVRDRTNRVEGVLTLILDPTTYGLKAWEVVDGARQTTRLTLTEQRAVASLSPRLFVIEDLNDPTARRKR
jgi:outer membrane lipoprotein-sorting protein